jgi:DNA-binding Lrp family transcriptional regulator
MPNIIRSITEKPMIDQIDRTILSILAKDARITNKDLAAAVGLSASACLERVRRLSERGDLQGTYAVVDPAAFGIGIQALVAVRLQRHTRSAVTSFEKKAWGLEQVVALYHVSGANDYVAHVVARDMDHLRDFTLDALTTLSEVTHLETSLIFHYGRKRDWPDLTSDGDAQGSGASPGTPRGSTPTIW